MGYELNESNNSTLVSKEQKDQQQFHFTESYNPENISNSL